MSNCEYPVEFMRSHCSSHFNFSKRFCLPLNRMCFSFFFLLFSKCDHLACVCMIVFRVFCCSAIKKEENSNLVKLFSSYFFFSLSKVYSNDDGLDNVLAVLTFEELWASSSSSDKKTEWKKAESKWKNIKTYLNEFKRLSDEKNSSSSSTSSTNSG